MISNPTSRLVLIFVFTFLLANNLFGQCPASNNLSSPYNSNNGQSGIMFDIVASATSAVVIKCFESNFDPGTRDIEIYYKAGTHVGFEGNAAAWTLIGTAPALASAGNDLPTYIPIPINITIPCTETYSFYITATTTGMNYTNGTGVGNVVSTDGNISVLEGTGKGYPFGADFTPRVFNGTVYYDLVGSCGCTNTVSSFPYNEGFETGTGLWTNPALGDNFDWTRDNAGTPSSNTGPTTGNGGSTWYMFIETSSPRVTGDEANFESPCFDLSTCSASDITFAYHMYGASTGSLHLEVESAPGSGIWTTLWSMSGDQGNTWHTATVSLNAYTGTTIKLRFRGVRGTSFTGDIAVDDVSVSCSVAPLCTNTVSTFPYNEGFETGTGLWNNVTGDNFDWTRDNAGTTSANTGPTTGNGGSTWYMYIETSSPRVTGDEANFESPCFDLSTCSSSDITFAYHMYGASTGSLHLEVETTPGSGVWTTLWSMSGDQGNTWHTATVSLNAYTGTTIKLRFRGVRGTSYTGDIAIDDVSVSCITGGCSTSGLTTYYATNNGQDGLMFDVTATNPVTVTCFDVNWDPGTFDCEIYYKTGTHVGFQGNAAAWTLIGNASGVVSAGNNLPTPLPITVSVPITAGQTVAFYITNIGGSNPSMNYTNGTGVGNIIANDANISIKDGTGKAYPFGTNYTPREFNGTVYYYTGVLPVELISFSGECEENAIEISWQTSSEINNDYFILEQSFDAENFEEVGKILGAGNSNNLQNYLYRQYYSNLNKPIYYRLKQVDFDGAIEYSNIIVVNTKTCFDENNNISINPNPATNETEIIFYNNEMIYKSLTVVDVLGNIMLEKNISTDSFKSIIDVSDFPSGIYFVNVLTIDNIISSHKLMKK